MDVKYPLLLHNDQEVGQCLNNRAENAHQPFRRRERAVLRFRRMKTLQTFASAHSAVHNHFNQDAVTASSRFASGPRSWTAVTSSAEALPVRMQNPPPVP
ncbi:MAG: DDE-type integrase/transposase/recombinase [Hyphomonadaceae bacterium]|nr:DDE-type integrase/transposase/recombinase [Hyphomonadaceae bacterium]